MNEEEKQVIDDMLGGEAAPGAEQEHARALGDIIRDYVRRGSVTRIVIRRGDDVLVNLPLNAGIVGGIIGAVAAPWALITAAIATAGFDCRVEIVKDDGEVVGLGFDRLGRAVKDAGADIAGEFRDVVDGIRSVSEQPCEPSVDEEIPFEDADSE